MKIGGSQRKHTLKMVAFITSLILWFYVLNAARIKIEKQVLVTYKLPADLVFATLPVQEVQVTLEGPRAFMRQIYEREERVVVDLTKPPWRDSLTPQPVLRNADFILPFGVKIEKISPRSLPLRLEKKIRRLLSVRAPIQGELPTELELTQLQVSPSEVEVEGPRSVVQQLKEITTRPIDIDSLYGQSGLNLEWALFDDRLTVLHSTAPTLSYRLKAKRANLLLENVPIRFTDGSVMQQESATVWLWAPNDLVRRIDKANLPVQVIADLASEGEQNTYTLRAVLPHRLHLVELKPQRVLVEPR